MKRRCRCGLKEHFAHFRMKRFGVLGLILMVAHILFHVAECLVLPAILVGLNEHVNAIDDENRIEISEQTELEIEKSWNSEYSLYSRMVLVDFEQTLLK